MEPPEDQLHVVPNVDGAEARVGLSEGGELVAVKLVRLHGDRVEGEALVDGKLCGEKKAEEAWRVCRNLAPREQTAHLR